MRLEGWERRLYAVIEDARGREYVLGEHDCFRVACRVIEALTGIDRWPEFKGYKTRSEALRNIATRGKNFKHAGDWFFGVEGMSPLLARRGDIVAITTDEPMRNTEGFIVSSYKEHHLGVVMGKNCVCLAERGWIELPVKSALCAWRVG
jgi:hypothetical protein